MTSPPTIDADRLPDLLRFGMSLVGSLAGLCFMMVANTDYFLRYRPDKLGLTYAAASVAFSFLGGWLSRRPRTWQDGLVNVAVAMAIAALIAFVTLLVHPNSVFNGYGDFDLG